MMIFAELLTILKDEGESLSHDTYMDIGVSLQLSGRDGSGTDALDGKVLERLGEFTNVTVKYNTQHTCIEDFKSVYPWPGDATGKRQGLDTFHWEPPKE